MDFVNDFDKPLKTSREAFCMWNFPGAKDIPETVVKLVVQLAEVAEIIGCIEEECSGYQCDQY